MTGYAYRGGKGKIYIEDAWVDGQDVPATPSWSLIKGVRDRDFAGGMGDAEASSYESDTEMYVGGLKDKTITFDMLLRQVAEATYTKLEDSYNNETPILIANMRGDIATTGVKGWMGPYLCTQLNETQDNGGTALANVTLRPFPGCDASGNLLDVNPMTVS